MQKITPFLWFDKNAEEAMNYYVSVFKNSKITHIQRYPDNVDDEHMKGMEGKVLTGVFELNGTQFMCLDGGPLFKFSEAVSFLIECADQNELDYYWEKLSLDPSGGQCGWTKDKFGISWQIVPRGMSEMFESSDRAAAGRAMQAMLQMKKIDIAAIEAAFAGK
jgi:predicted 3-demethylubiquinone-9 3-methyltransferase (glyoxalase superfamily)